MIAGVRMRLPVTVWNSTVDTAMAQATRIRPQSFRPRKPSTNSQLPRTFSVMNKTVETTAAPASSVSTMAGEKRIPLTKLLTPPQQQPQEDGAADDSEHGADRDLVWVTDQS